MRNVFSSHSELAHVWANQLQASGRGGNMFFNGASIYSYGSHYEIAKIVQAPDGSNVVFINSNGYSSSTGKHTGHVLNAIPLNLKKFYVPFTRGLYGQSFHISNLGGIISAVQVEINQLLTSQLKAISATHKFYQASKLLNTINEISSLFGLPIPTRPENWDRAEQKAEHLKATASDRARAKELKALAKDQELLDLWLKHEFNSPLYNIPIHFRLSRDGQNIETTKGARVPKIEAIRLLAKIRANESVKGEKIAGFTVLDSNDQDLIIGCHKISWNIANKFMEKVN